MYAVATFLLVLAALPPLSYAAAGLLFFVPVLCGLQHHRGHGYRVLGEFGLLGGMLGGYIYFGVSAQAPALYGLAIGLCVVLFALCAWLHMRLFLLGKRWPIVLGVLVWTAGEQLVNRLGLPFAFALALDDSLPLLQPVAVVGPWGLGALLLAAQTALFIAGHAFAARAWRTAGVWCTLTLATGVGAFVHGEAMLARTDPALATVAAVQTNISSRLWRDRAANGELEKIVAQHRRLHADLARAPDPESVISVWPESAMPGAWTGVADDALVMKAGKRAIVQAYARVREARESRVVVFAGGARPVSTSAKVLPVPVAETGIRGAPAVTVHAGLEPPVGALICYESARPDLARQLVAAGARWLAVMSNDAYHGPSLLHAFHFSLARLRAVENRVTVVRASNGGKSAIIEPDGRLAAALPMFTVAAATGPIRAPGQALYTRVGHLVDASLLIAGLALGLAACAIRRPGTGRSVSGARAPGLSSGIAAVAALGVVLIGNLWQHRHTVRMHHLQSATPIIARPTAFTSEAPVLRYVRRHHGFVRSRWRTPGPVANLSAWAAAHGLRTDTGLLSEGAHRTRTGALGLVRLANGRRAVIVSVREQVVQLIEFPAGVHHRVGTARLARMLAGRVTWIAPRSAPV